MVSGKQDHARRNTSPIGCCNSPACRRTITPPLFRGLSASPATIRGGSLTQPILSSRRRPGVSNVPVCFSNESTSEVANPLLTSDRSEDVSRRPGFGGAFRDVQRCGGNVFSPPKTSKGVAVTPISTPRRHVQTEDVAARTPRATNDLISQIKALEEQFDRAAFRVASVSSMVGKRQQGHGVATHPAELASGAASRSSSAPSTCRFQVSPPACFAQTTGTSATLPARISGTYGLADARHMEGHRLDNRACARSSPRPAKPGQVCRTPRGQGKNLLQSGSGVCSAIPPESRIHEQPRMVLKTLPSVGRQDRGTQTERLADECRENRPFLSALAALRPLLAGSQNAVALSDTDKKDLVQLLAAVQDAGPLVIDSDHLNSRDQEETSPPVGRLSTRVSQKSHEVMELESRFNDAKSNEEQLEVATRLVGAREELLALLIGEGVLESGSPMLVSRSIETSVERVVDARCESY